ncbi:helix-turn-helix domain-containing protein [Variovorax sp. J2P1-59]|uniref:TetR/AcrR family transcriptional regulator n=1 Tax=Variovorax flavidus TaxID=3053501 RepID=UPI002577D917|nr:TetR/AcrR family transcriptional regulator [Variovorax sp. J2P1-59]MDM0075200.1 helix-turn-helix domain-containing protein [Variovorax sp. J2P1-59]
MKAPDKRQYHSETRSEAAERTRARILDAGKFLFSRKGIDATTIAQIAKRAGVSEPTVYAVVKSKAGLLHTLMHDAIFGPRFKDAHQKLEGLGDPVQRIAMSAHVARAIYEGESAELSLLMKSSAFSPELRKTNQSFEALRREMQRERIDALFAAKRARKGLTKEAAATLLWMLTSREVYHKLVHESGWSPDAFQAWLEQTLLEALTDEPASDRDA